MKTYLDASVLVSLLIADAHTGRAEAWYAKGHPVAFSAWTLAECSSALSFRVRRKSLTAEERSRAESDLDEFARKVGQPTPVLATDFATTRRLLRTEVLLRAPDALHLAIAQRERLVLATLDARLANAARRAGVEMAEI